MVLASYEHGGQLTDYKTNPTNYINQLVARLMVVRGIIQYNSANTFRNEGFVSVKAAQTKWYQQEEVELLVELKGLLSAARFEQVVSNNSVLSPWY
ncbi:MAG: hypothetical protein WC307_06910 [Candidatus Nanoarchaeia archaeon]|jgi:hypothetical protein